MKRRIFITIMAVMLICILCIPIYERNLPGTLDPNWCIIPEFDYGINMQTEYNDVAVVVTVKEIKHPTGLYDYEYKNILVAYCDVEDVIFGEYNQGTMEIRLKEYDPFEKNGRYLVFVKEGENTMAGKFYRLTQDGIYDICAFGYLRPYTRMGRLALESFNTLGKMKEYLADKKPGYRDDSLYTMYR